MGQLKMVFQKRKLDRDPSLEQIPIRRYGVVVDGVNLPSAIAEDVAGFSLCPSYSAKQLRRIERIAKKKADHENRYSMSSQGNNENCPECCDLLTTSSYLRSHPPGEDLE